MPARSPIIRASSPASPAPGASAGRATPRPCPHESWRACLDDILATSGRRIGEAGLIDMTVVDEIRRRADRAGRALDAVSAIPFIADAATAIVVVSDSGDISGLVDVNGLCWGDPRFAPAATLVALLNAGQPTALAEAWVALTGQERDGLFWLYAGIACIQLMAEYGRTDLGTATGFTCQRQAAGCARSRRPYWVE